MTVFKNYEGQPIIIPDHKHKVEDSKRNDNVAYATLSEDGFMSKEDRIKLTSLKKKMDFLNDRMQYSVYVTKEEPSVTLIPGREFNNFVRYAGKKIVFTKNAISDDKKSHAEIVSTNESNTRAYLYTENSVTYISPEIDNCIMYANSDCSSMFHNCQYVNSFDFSNFDTSKVTDMSYMFNTCVALGLLNIENFDTSKVTDMSYMFQGCSFFNSFYNNLNTSKVINMDYMFEGCKKLYSSITIMNPNITSYKGMFLYCSTDIFSFKLNYSHGCKNIAQNMINEKSPESNIILGVEK